MASTLSSLYKDQPAYIGKRLQEPFNLGNMRGTYGDNYFIEQTGFKEGKYGMGQYRFAGEQAVLLLFAALHSYAGTRSRYKGGITYEFSSILL